MTKEKATRNMAGNNILDRIWSGFAGGFFLLAGYVLIFDHVQATEPMNYILAGGGTALALYTLLAPMLRGR